MTGDMSKEAGGMESIRRIHPSPLQRDYCGKQKWHQDPAASSDAGLETRSFNEAVDRGWGTGGSPGCEEGWETYQVVFKSGSI